MFNSWITRRKSNSNRNHFEIPLLIHHFQSIDFNLKAIYSSTFLAIFLISNLVQLSCLQRKITSKLHFSPFSFSLICLGKKKRSEYHKVCFKKTVLISATYVPCSITCNSFTFSISYFLLSAPNIESKTYSI